MESHMYVSYEETHAFDAYDAFSVLISSLPLDLHRAGGGGGGAPQLWWMCQLKFARMQMPATYS